MTRPEVLALLRALGETKEAVAASLLAAGVRGWPAEACGCPLAVYLHTRAVSDRLVAVQCGYARVYFDRWASIELPDPVEAFRAAFDAGEFPALMRPPPRPVTQQSPRGRT